MFEWSSNLFGPTRKGIQVVSPWIKLFSNNFVFCLWSNKTVSILLNFKKSRSFELLEQILHDFQRYFIHAWNKSFQNAWNEWIFIPKLRHFPHLHWFSRYFFVVHAMIVTLLFEFFVISNTVCLNGICPSLSFSHLVIVPEPDAWCNRQNTFRFHKIVSTLIELGIR